ncbi:phosphoglycerate kinase [Dehalococcoidia bacterium]|nr:phosphoglycerate kinase [Dehalococcoidia bacterium]
MVHKKTVRDVSAAGKVVLLRTDYNVPFHPGTLTISDDSRIQASLETLQYLTTQGAKVIVCSHLGRPNGSVVPKFSLAPVAQRLSQKLQSHVPMVMDFAAASVLEQLSLLLPGDVMMLENLRFHPGEEGNDPSFARELASLADFYVDDAFGTAHRAHASTEGVTHFLPAFAGLLMELELNMLSRVLENPARPFLVVLGGAKVSDKIGVIEHLADGVDAFLIGGGMAAAFLKAEGKSVGRSAVASEDLDLAHKILGLAKTKGFDLMTPSDVVLGDALDEHTSVRLTDSSEIPDGWLVMDIGPTTARSYALLIHDAGTTVWNGPMGVFEWDPFAYGTKTIALGMAESNGITILGGGSTADAAFSLDLANCMTHVSTGGGASLEFLEGKELPGVTALQDA